MASNAVLDSQFLIKLLHPFATRHKLYCAITDGAVKFVSFYRDYVRSLARSIFK